MQYVYIIKSQKDNTNYVGVTNNLVRRINEHNSGNSKYSSTKSPYKLIWYCAFSDKDKAYAFEKYLKSSSGHAFSNKRLV